MFLCDFLLFQFGKCHIIHMISEKRELLQAYVVSLLDIDNVAYATIIVQMHITFV
jgi:hypothetical protein